VNRLSGAQGTWWGSSQELFSLGSRIYGRGLGNEVAGGQEQELPLARKFRPRKGRKYKSA